MRGREVKDNFGQSSFDLDFSLGDIVEVTEGEHSGKEGEIIKDRIEG